MTLKDRARWVKLANPPSCGYQTSHPLFAVLNRNLALREAFLRSVAVTACPKKRVVEDFSGTLFPEEKSVISNEQKDK